MKKARQFVDRMLGLLDRWVEYELFRMNSRALIIPETTYKWEMDALYRFHRVAEGICWERCTAPRGSTVLEEFGVAFRKLEEREQQLILTDRYGSPEEWRERRAYWSVSEGHSERILEGAWERLTDECRRRGLLTGFYAGLNK